MSTDPEWFLDQLLPATRNGFAYDPAAGVLEVSDTLPHARPLATAQGDDVWEQIGSDVEDDHDGMDVDAPRISERTPLQASASENLAAVIAGLLQKSGFRNLNKVTCELDARRIKLSGTVQSFHEKQVAQTIAASVGDVRSIDNQIVVTP